jgi:quercetin dioxygenase-like cupin family protein
MKKYNLNDMIKGWFIGDFEPTLHHTDLFEVAVKRYKKGDSEERHTHKIATEFTVIISGDVMMDGNKYTQDDIIVIEPNQSTDFKCLTDVTTLVVKTPSAKNDKYII